MERKEIIVRWLEIFVLTIAMTVGWFFLGILQDDHSTIDHHTWEPVDVPVQTAPIYEEFTPQEKDLLETDEFLEDLANWLLQTGTAPNHGSAKKIWLEKLCWVYSSLCNKTVWKWSYTDQEKVYYQWLLIYLITSLDNRMNQRNTLADTISTITLSPDTPDRRGSAWHTHVSFNTDKIDSWNEFFQVAVHESGHLIDLWVITGRSVFKDPDFTEFGRAMWATNDPSIDFYKISRTNENTRIRTQWPEHFVSGYAMKNVYEDFWESMALYLLYNDLFKAKAINNLVIKKKYQYLDDLFGWQHIQRGTQYLRKYRAESNYWDVTRLSEELK
jgi:hypothetical protein